MALYDVPAPAKVNLFLHVVGRRPDGYHLLETVFRFVDLCDTLSFDLRADGMVVLEGDAPPGLNPEDNLIVRAARALQQATGTSLGAQVSCAKRIPAGGGLGGGSSDAASTLLALNRLWKTGLSRRQLMQLALPLGADVPVFVFGQSAFARGIGEDLTAVDLPSRAYLVVQPPVQVPTGPVFSDPHLTRDEKPVKISFFADWQKQSVPVDASGALPFFGGNNLEAVVFNRHPEVLAAHRYLAALGVANRMSGSGACLFAEFASMQQAAVIQAQIVGKIKSHSRHGCASGVVKNAWACQGLAIHPLHSWAHD